MWRQVCLIPGGTDCLMRAFTLPKQGVELPEVSPNLNCSVIL